MDVNMVEQTLRVEADGGTDKAETEITLGVLNAIHADSNITQRRISSDLGIALGLANAYLKRCVKKGLIKISEAPANRYAYYLTPHGFTEKSRLTAEYLSQSFNFFRSSRTQCAAALNDCAERGWKKVALAGASDLAEIAALCSADSGVALAGIVDEKRAGSRLVGLSIVAKIGDLGEVDALLITDMANPQARYDAMAMVFPPERIMTLKMLHISRRPLQLAE
jgi:DNA-binding MarR family transcriptional regulator